MIEIYEIYKVKYIYKIYSPHIKVYKSYTYICWLQVFFKNSQRDRILFSPYSLAHELYCIVYWQGTVLW